MYDLTYANTKIARQNGKNLRGDSLPLYRNPQ